MKHSVIIDDDAVEARFQEKADARIRDLERLQNREVTPEELQDENSIFPAGWVENCVIENLYENVGR